jgi:hypothetical protein
MNFDGGNENGEIQPPLFDYGTRKLFSRYSRLPRLNETDTQ